MLSADEVVPNKLACMDPAINHVSFDCGMVSRCLLLPLSADEVVPKKLAETKKFAGQKIVQVRLRVLVAGIGRIIICFLVGC